MNDKECITKLRSYPIPKCTSNRPEDLEQWRKDFVEPIEYAIQRLSRQKGHWEIDGHHYRCSECGKTLAIIINESDEGLIACPFCKADMREE